MMITYQVEGWESYYRDSRREALWWEHYRELERSHLNKMPMEPDLSAYRQAERAGGLLVMVARSAGEMVGYAIVLVHGHMHYRPILCGFEDALFLTKSARKGRVGIKLVAETNKALAKRGVKKVFWHSKAFAPIAGIFTLLGMQKSDEIYSMWLV